MEILKFSQFSLLQESRSIELDLSITNTSDITDIISKFAPWYDINNIKTRIYRGLDETADVMQIKPSEHDRSAYTPNYADILQSNLPAWSLYPKRRKSIISVCDIETAEMHGEAYLVIPLKADQKFGVCELESWKDVFPLPALTDEFEVETSEFNYLLHNIFTSLQMKVTNYEEMKAAFAKLESIPLKNFYSSLETEQKLEYLLKKFTSDHILDGLNDLMNPDKNGFELISYNNTTVIPLNSEVWTSSDCLMIKNDLIERYIDNK